MYDTVMRRRRAAPGISDQDLSDITGAIYSTVDASEEWPAVLARIAGAINAKSGLVRRLDLQPRRQVVVSHHYNLDSDLQFEYCDGLVADDPYLEALQRLPPGRMVTNDGLIDLDRLRGTEFYRHYMKPLDNHFIVGGFLERDDEGGQTIIGFHRHTGADQFGRNEVEFVRQLAPHIKQAMHLQRLLGRERDRADSAEAALEALSVASLLVDRQGGVVHANGAGERLLRNGLGLRIRDGRVVARDPRLMAMLETLIARAADETGTRAGAVPGSFVLPVYETGTANLLVVGMPVTRTASMLREGWPEARVALYIGDLDDTGMLRPEVLRAIYGLTPAEARLAVAVGRGRELAVLSSEWGVSSETLRSHLKVIFAKTGVNRQVDLVRLLAGAPWKLAGPDGEADLV